VRDREARAARAAHPGGHDVPLRPGRRRRRRDRAAASFGGSARRRVAFSGRIGRKALDRGRHRAVLVARNSGSASPAVRLAFRIVRR
jgi:hypothetical protein